MLGPVPENIEVENACPMSIRLVWDTVPGATSYDVYLLGERYMEEVGSTADVFYDVPVDNPEEENWFSVSANGPDWEGRRAVAVSYSGGLLNCTQENDLKLLEIVSPGARI